MERMKIFEERRLNHKKHVFTDFFEDRKFKKDNVTQKKLEIQTLQDQNLQEQIQKTYKNDPNYLIRDINYGQVETTSPSFTMRAKYEIGSIFQTDKYDKNYDFSTPKKSLNKLEHPNFALIRPRYPAFSFGSSQRFNSISIDGRNSRANNNLKKSGAKYETERNEFTKEDFGNGSLYFYGDLDSQSFLKMQIKKRNLGSILDTISPQMSMDMTLNITHSNSKTPLTKQSSIFNKLSKFNNEISNHDVPSTLSGNISFIPNNINNFIKKKKTKKKKNN